jgi:3D (Asp-Asp-Asp) domain-containing protein
MKNYLFLIALMITMISAQIANAQTASIASNPNPANICFGQGTNVSLTATGVGAIVMGYAWSNGGNTQAINVSPGATTTYTVTITFLGGATATANQTVNVLPAPTATIAAGPSVICAGSSVTLNCVEVGSAYQWYLGGIAIFGATSQNFSASAGGDYTVLITVGNCTAFSAIHTLTVNPLPVAAFTPNNQGQNYCPNTGLLTATTGVGYSYQWLWSATQTGGPWLNAPGVSTNDTYQITTAGYHALKTTDGNGCISVTNY